MGIALAAIAFRTWLNPRRRELSSLRCCSTLLLYAAAIRRPQMSRKCNVHARKM